MSLQEQPPLEEAIIELYLNVKVRSNEEINNYDESMFEKEKQKLREVNSHTILDYIKSSIEILMNLKSEEQNNKLSKKAKQKKSEMDKYGFDQDASEALSMTSQSL